MKKYINILFAAALTLSFTACQTFLTRDNLTSLDDVTYWRTEQNVRLFVNGAYGNYFSGYSDNWGQVNAPGVYSSGEYSDDRTSSGAQVNILLSDPLPTVAFGWPVVPVLPGTLPMSVSGTS